MNPKNWWLAEPVAIGTVVRTGVLLAMAFGAHMTLVQLAAIMAFTEAVLAVVTRQSVHTQASVDQQVGTIASLNQKAGV